MLRTTINTTAVITHSLVRMVRV